MPKTFKGKLFISLLLPATNRLGKMEGSWKSNVLYVNQRKMFVVSAATDMRLLLVICVCTIGVYVKQHLPKPDVLRFVISQIILIASSK